MALDAGAALPEAALPKEPGARLDPAVAFLEAVARVLAQELE
jgi:hypothetical protein